MRLLIAAYHSSVNPQRGRCEPRLRVVFGQVRAGCSADRRAGAKTQRGCANLRGECWGASRAWCGEMRAGCLPEVVVRDRLIARDNVIGRFGRAGRSSGSSRDHGRVGANWSNNGSKVASKRAYYYITGERK